MAAATIKEATFWAARMEISTGQSDCLLYQAAADMEPVLTTLKGGQDTQKAVEEKLQACMAEARALIARRRDDVGNRPTR